MSLASLHQEFKSAFDSNNFTLASAKLVELKRVMLGLNSLPPLNYETPNAEEERKLAKSVLETAVFLSISLGDKDEFQRYMSSLKPYYSDLRKSPSNDTTGVLMGLNLLFLLVENRLSDFHCEIELLSYELQKHPAVVFCTQLDKHLMLGSYDQVLVAASHPPVKYFSFFLTSLLETVRVNIGDCVTSAYVTLTVAAASKILMFTNEKETLDFIAEFYPNWVVSGNTISLTGNKVAKSEEIPSIKLITQSLSYATELERIV